MQYILNKKIYEGRYGVIYRANKINSNEEYAALVNPKDYAEREDVKKLLVTEINILKELKHENIIKLIEIFLYKNFYYFIFEWCNGYSLLTCLQRYIKKNKKPFSEEIVQYLMRQIVNGLKYIHQHGIIHRDIKLTNILVQFDSQKDKEDVNMLKSKIKISDFKISKIAKIAYSAIGTAAYTEPKILKNIYEKKPQINEGYDKSADIWSLGAVCYEMLIGYRLFKDLSMSDLMQKVEIGNYSIPTSLSKEIVSFLIGMLQNDSKKRFTIEKLSEQDFLTKDVKNFSKIDLGLLYSKVQNSTINININNKSVWDIFNDKQKLSAINTILNLTPDDDEQGINYMYEFNNNYNNISKLNRNNTIPNSNNYNPQNNIEISNYKRSISEEINSNIKDRQIETKNNNNINFNNAKMLNQSYYKIHNNYNIYQEDINQDKKKKLTASTKPNYPKIFY